VTQPIITPGKWLARAALPPEVKGCRVAVVGFCRFGEMKQKLAAESLSECAFSHLDLSHQFSECAFSHLDLSHQFVGQADGHPILALECLYGGPMSATVIEELAHYGVKTVIGYGYAGSLTRAVPVGQIVLAEMALVSDGTSREYLPDAEAVQPDAALARHFRACAERRGVALREVTVWTTDALYREYPEKIARWREVGAEIVNMDTAHFYAVSQVVGVAAVYACVISDCVEGPVWDDGFARVKQAMGDLQDVILEAAARAIEGPKQPSSVARRRQ
jgi:uridine phosphorylase